ncbi:MAG: carbon storage regulator CsrA [Desulfitobacteriia bacterium]
MPGFEEEKEFLFWEEEGTPLAHLESAQNKEIGFVLLRPQLFLPDYLHQVDLSPEEIELLEVKEDDKPDVWAIMTLSLSDLSKSTVNLRAPLLINSRAAKGLQIILSEEGYSAASRSLLNLLLRLKREVPGKGLSGKMLVLARKINEKILIGDDIEITIVAVSGENVRLGIKAPPDVKILRSEVYEEVRKQNLEAASAVKLQNEEVALKLKQMLNGRVSNRE